MDLKQKTFLDIVLLERLTDGNDETREMNFSLSLVSDSAVSFTDESLRKIRPDRLCLADKLFRWRHYYGSTFGEYYCLCGISHSSHFLIAEHLNEMDEEELAEHLFMVFLEV